MYRPPPSGRLVLLKHMRKLVSLILMLIITGALYCAGCNDLQQKTADAVKVVVAGNMEQFHHFIRDTLYANVAQHAPVTELKPLFLHARELYKSIEWATEYFMPTTTRFVNGPPLPEIENEENKVFEAEGLQVVEELLYSGDTLDYPELERQVRLLQTHASTYSRYWKEIEITEAQVLDAIKLQLFRMVALGITGFDAPLAKSGISEAGNSIKSIRRIIKDCFDQDWKELDDAAAYAGASVHFDRFDRARFIRQFINPLTTRITSYQAQNAGYISDKRLLRPSAATMFDSGAFDPDAFTPDSSYYYSVEKRELGRELFNDPILSRNGTRSCASCHNPDKAFTDGFKKSPSLHNRSLQRNAPTLLNAALQPWQFYDMRTTNLENQSGDVIANRDEMHGDIGAAVVAMRNDDDYNALFRKAFPQERQFSEKHVQNALASYVRSLTGLTSRFDRYMRGEATLSIREIQGFNLFAGKAKCGTCHFMPLFNGAVPPLFLKMDSEVIGTPADKDATVLDPDPGRYNTHQLAPYAHAFKTTTVRNITRTAPYMHNGVFDTIDEVLHFYNEGGGAGMGLKVENQTLPPEKLKLTEPEKDALKAFLNALNDA